MFTHRICSGAIGRAGHLAQQWRRVLRDRGQHPADAADLGGRAGGHHQRARLPLRHQRAGEGQAEAVAKPRVALDGLGALVHRHRLARQCRLVDAQVVRCQQAQVGGHDVARRQQHQVPGHQLGRVDVVRAAVAAHRGARRQQVPDGLQRPLGLAFLNEADYRVDNHHGQDHAGVDPVAQRGGDGAGGHQHVQQQVVELPGQSAQHARAGGLLDPVRAMAVAAALRFVAAQALSVRGQRSQRVRGRQGVPGDFGVAWCGRRRVHAPECLWRALQAATPRFGPCGGGVT